MQNLEVVLQSLIEYKNELENQRQMYYEAIANNLEMQDKTKLEIELLQRELCIDSTTD